MAIAARRRVQCTYRWARAWEAAYSSPTPAFSSPLMSSSQPINYARIEGIQHKELGAAIVFAILYIPCIPIFIYLSFKRYTFVWRSLVLFALGECLLYRIVDHELTDNLSQEHSIRPACTTRGKLHRWR